MVDLVRDWYFNLLISGILIMFGLYCLLSMRNLIKLLIGIEIIAKGVLLALISASSARGSILTGQSLAITFIVVEVSVVAVALALVINLFRHTGSLDVKKLTKLKG
uniref:NADH-quinone oxidoreductase subunit K n=1 Tax=candidate division WOR-3 bacterium TaxID=2052148 RepID=A0A7V0Z5S4_UNCW3